MRNRLALLVMLVPLSLGATAITGCGKSSSGSSEGDAKVYNTKGTIKNFGPDKKYVSIAHENIPGYMSAMTMSFEPQAPTQLDGLNAGDKVDFSFKADGGKHTLTAIKKTP